MPLTERLQDILRRAIEDYAFPPDYFDFLGGTHTVLTNTREVETRIRSDLISGDPERVKNGLSNVLYWGYAQMGIRDERVRRFRDNVTKFQLREACQLFRPGTPPSLLDIKGLQLPEFSRISFVSKIRMFLDPENSATLDRQIMKIHAEYPETLLANFRVQPTQIPITRQNAEAYEHWCRKMREISDRYFDGHMRAVDVERGLFQLVQAGKTTLAAEILKNA